MDYGYLLVAGARLLWQRPILWAFGLLAVSGLSVSEMALRWYVGARLPAFLNGATLATPSLTPEGLSTPLLIFLGGAILLWFLNIAGQAGIIGVVGQTVANPASRAKRERLPFMRALLALVALDTLLFLPALLLFLAVIVTTTLMFVLMILAIDAGQLALGSGFRLFGLGLLLCVGPLLIIAVPLILGTLLVRLLAFRVAILERLGTRVALSRAWALLRRSPGAILFTAVLLWGVRQLIGTVVSVARLPLEALALRPLLLALSTGGSVERADGLAFSAAAILGVLGLLVGSFLFAYVAAVWTLAYLELPRAEVEGAGVDETLNVAAVPVGGR